MAETTCPDESSQLQSILNQVKSAESPGKAAEAVLSLSKDEFHCLYLNIEDGDRSAILDAICHEKDYRGSILESNVQTSRQRLGGWAMTTGAIGLATLGLTALQSRGIGPPELDYAAALACAGSIGAALASWATAINASTALEKCKDATSERLQWIYQMGQERERSARAEAQTASVSSARTDSSADESQ